MSDATEAADRLEAALDPDKRGGWTRLMVGDPDLGDANEIEDLHTVLAAVRADPGYQFEWEYICHGDGFIRHVDTEAEAEKWAGRDYTVSKRTRAIKAGPWIEVAP